MKKPSEGLTDFQAKKLLDMHGENIIKEKKSRNMAVKFLLQLCDPMVITLIIAAAISFVTAKFEGDSDYIDPIIILGIVIVNAVVGVVQESKAEHAIEKLRELSAPKASVIRNSKEIKIPSSLVVPGDLLVLRTGDRVAADARLVECVELSCDESALTGEAHPAHKQSGGCCDSQRPAAEQNGCVFASTTVLGGHGKAVVTKTGMDTQIGKIADMLGKEESPQTPLQQRLAKISRVLGIGAVCICGLIFALGMVRHDSLLSSFMLAVSLAVAAIPEGLPAVVTIVLSSGLGQMAKAKAIVRKLTAVEALGSATYICSDKTGTLTQNKMTVCKLYSGMCELSVASQQAKTLLGMAALCCNAGKDFGEPTEKAIVAAADKYRATVKGERLSEIPFNSRDKLMSVTVKTAQGTFLIVKGAPEKVLARCVAYGNAALYNGRMAENGLRVLAVAVKEIGFTKDASDDGLTFLGLIGIEDPERNEAHEAIRLCRTAGITPVMITGDNPATALAIAKKLNIASNRKEVMTSDLLDSMTDEELRKKVKQIRVFARVSPEHKVRIVRALQAGGEVVAMTGDGVNDAPALKAADIGCAMGKGGTQVAKGAADIVLADDNFATIVKAVREGRGIYDNIKKVVRFMISSNIGEIMLILIAGFMKLPSPMLPIQLLWTNLVTDSLPGMALGREKIEPDIMQRPPVEPQKGLFTRKGWVDILLEGILVGMPSLVGFVLANGLWGVEVARTVCFCTLSITELLHALNCRSDRSLLKTGIFSNSGMNLAFFVCLALQVSVATFPMLTAVFGTVSLNHIQWLTVAALSLFITLSVELSKLLTKGREKDYN